MKNNIAQKIILGAVAIIFVFSTGFFIAPKKASAQLAVTDIGDTIQNTLSELENSVTAEATLGENIQDTVLNKIATAIAKQLLMEVTAQVVTWINSGFDSDHDPAFIQNPTTFFENIGDQATGAFISQTGVLSSLCSPFSLQVRLAIAQQQRQNDDYGQNQYSCTLSTIIQNGENAASGASINGFTAGDFSQGGWPAFEALVTQPQNTPNGAYLTAEDQLQQQIAAQTTQKQNELNQGSGFLSWESCKPTNAANVTDEDSEAPPDPYNIAAENDPNQTCTIETPGSVISATLNKHLAVPTENLELANSINDIINAAFSELVVVALQKGLTSVTSSSNGGSSYLQSSLYNAGSQSFTSTRNSLLNTVTPYLDNAKTVDANYSTALNLVLTASSTIGNALSCYQNLGEGTTTSFFWNNGPTTLQNTLSTTVIPLAGLMISKGGTASTTDGQYQQMYEEILNATTLEDLSAPEQTLTSISTSGGFPTTASVKASANDLKDAKSTIDPIQQQAEASLQECQSLTAPTTTTTATTSTSTFIQ